MSRIKKTFSHSIILLIPLILSANLLSSGCSLPKIVILHDPLTAEEHDNLGRAYESQQKFDLALQQYHAALKIDKNHVPSLLLLGDLSYKLKNYEEAESAYTKALKLQPENGDIYNNLCWVYLDQGRKLEKAEELIKKAITLTPEHRPYYLDTLGVILLRLGRTPESIIALREAVDLLPGDKPELLAEAYGHLAEAYKAAGDEEHYKDAVQKQKELRASK